VATNVALFSLILGLALNRNIPKSSAKTFDAVNTAKKVHVNAKVTGDVGVSTEELEEIVDEQLKILKFEVIEESEKGDLEVYVRFLRDDGDLDDDGIPDSKDSEDEGDGFNDVEEQLVTDSDNSWLISSPQPLFVRASFGSLWFGKSIFVISAHKPASHDEENRKRLSTRMLSHAGMTNALYFPAINISCA
jgi:hypothetical protein